MFTFTRDKKLVELQGYMRRVADLTCPNLPPSSGNYRLLDRYNRSLPVLIVPYADAMMNVDEASFAVTKDMCDHGLSLISCQPHLSPEVIVGIRLSGSPSDNEPEEPFFVLGRVRQCSELGGGYWQVGIELTEVMKSGTVSSALARLAQKLLPSDASEESALAT